MTQHFRQGRKAYARLVKDARCDDVYTEGMNWLNSLAGEPLREGEHVVQFSDEI